MSEIKPLAVIDGKTLLSLDVEPPKFIISRFLPAGLHMLAGSPKISIIGAIPWFCQFDEWICFKQIHSFFYIFELMKGCDTNLKTPVSATRYLWMDWVRYP